MQKKGQPLSNKLTKETRKIIQEGYLENEGQGYRQEREYLGIRAARFRGYVDRLKANDGCTGGGKGGTAGASPGCCAKNPDAVTL
jgi:hypothetical protein